MQSLLVQHGDLVASADDALQGVTAKNAQTVIAAASLGTHSERAPTKPPTYKMPRGSTGAANIRQLPGAGRSSTVQSSMPVLQDASRIVGAMLKLYRVTPPSEIRRVLIVSYFRSGSTFLGDILQTPLKTFYHFEPYHITGATRIRFGDVSEKECARLFGHLMRCEFDQLVEYMAWVSQQSNQFLVRHNKFLWRHCVLKNNICFNATYMQGMCQRSPLQ
ncbi:carbohydrate sulfotransferase 3-like, partial [Tropilaelaps mercedesae]